MKTLGYWFDRLKMSLKDDTCPLCHQTLLLKHEETLCAACEKRIYLRQTVPVMEIEAGPLYAACEFPYPIKQLIYGLKFYDKTQHGLTLAEILVHYWQKVDLSKNIRWVVLPIPAHEGKPFAHVPLIARPFASHFGYDFVENGLQWTRPVQTQHAIFSRRMRGRNMLKALQLEPEMAKRYGPDTKFLIVDDLLTTGATLAEAMLAIHREMPTCKTTALAVSHVPLSLNRDK